MTASFESRLEKLEKNVDRIANPDKLSDVDDLVLSSQIAFVEYVTPLSKLPESQTFLFKVRSTWGKDIMHKYIKKMQKGNFIKRLSEEQIYYLLEGKEKPKE